MFLAEPWPPRRVHPCKVDRSIDLQALTLEPNGWAAPEKTVPCGFDSHRRFFQARFATSPGHAAHRPVFDGLGLCVPSMGSDDDDVVNG